MLSRMLMMGLSAAAALGACKPKPASVSEPRIINGKEISVSEFPAVVPIHRFTSTGFDEFSTQVCTGTFVAPRVLITAAHCITSEVDGDGFVKTPGLERVHGIIPSRVLVHPGYEIYTFDPLHDVALMEFASELAPGVATLSPRPAKEGDAVEIVGFGRHDPDSGESAGTKRWGRNTLHWAGDTLRFYGLPNSVTFDGEDTASAKGDSGGPMFLDGALIGTTVGGAVDEGRKISEYTHLHAPEIRLFFVKAQSHGIVFDLPRGYLE